MKHYIESTDSELEEFLNWKKKKNRYGNAHERISEYSTLHKTEQAQKEPQKAEKIVGKPSKCSFCEVKLVPEKEVSFNFDFSRLTRTPLLKNLDLFELFFNEGKRNYFLMHCLHEIAIIGKIKINVNAKMKMDDTTTRFVKSITIENTGIKDGKISLTISLDCKRVIYTYYETKTLVELDDWLFYLTDVDKFFSTIKFNFMKGFVEKPATILAKKYVNEIFIMNHILIPINKKINDLDIHNINIEKCSKSTNIYWSISLMNNKHECLRKLTIFATPAGVVRIIAGIIQKKEKALKKLMELK